MDIKARVQGFFGPILVMEDTSGRGGVRVTAHLETVWSVRVREVPLEDGSFYVVEIETPQGPLHIRAPSEGAAEGMAAALRPMPDDEKGAA